MSKNIFINNLDTYVSQAIFKELRNDQPGEDGEANPDAYNIFGTYISKDSSVPPEGIKKMLKVCTLTNLALLSRKPLQMNMRFLPNFEFSLLFYKPMNVNFYLYAAF